jgi:ring-1,2-phenylacetyl-CoA epoxidase subunit PaaA
VPQAHILGLTVPDPNLKWNEETKRYDWGQIDWNEFWQVVKGHGPCNKQRLSARIAAHENGAWVRDAAMAYAEKQANKEIKKAI